MYWGGGCRSAKLASMKSALRILLVGALAVVLTPAFDAVAAPPPPKPAELLDRIVAVVGDKALFLSELRHRARPLLARLEAVAADARAKGAARTEVYREMLERMIDEVVEQREADKLHVSVSADEVDGAIRQVASGIKLTEAELLAEAARQGMPERDYRDEIRRQILEAKLIQLRVRGRVRVTDVEARATYAEWLKERSGPNAPAEVRDTKPPSFESVKEQMKERALLEAIDRERKVWLQDLRKTLYIEVML